LAAKEELATAYQRLDQLEEGCNSASVESAKQEKAATGAKKTRPAREGQEEVCKAVLEKAEVFGTV
jgi:hypothetical protein